MAAQIELKTAPGAEGVADQALQAFRRETRELAPYLEGIQVRLEEIQVPGGRDRKSIRVRVDFLSGGRYLVETEGEDWSGALSAAAQQAARGASLALRRRWEMAEP
jgi:hypothetical protein